MTPEQQAEAVELQRQMHAYFDGLAVAGIDDRMIVTAAVVAACERLLRVGSPTQAAAFLRGMALNMERTGPALKAAIAAR